MVHVYSSIHIPLLETKTKEVEDNSFLVDKVEEAMEEVEEVTADTGTLDKEVNKVMDKEEGVTVVEVQVTPVKIIIIKIITQIIIKINIRIKIPS